MARISDSVPPSFVHLTPGGGVSSGIRRVVAELAAAQVSHGRRAVIHLTGEDPFGEDPRNRAGRTVDIIHSPLAGPAGWGFSPAAERWVKTPEAETFGVLHQHGIWPAMSRVTMRWRKKYDRPTVVSPHGALESLPLSYSKWKKALALMAYERRNLHDASCLHATAEREVTSFRDFGLRNPIAVISNGVPGRWITSAGDGAKFRAEHAIPGDVRLMLYLSRVHPKKNLLGLIVALARLKEELGDWHLVVAGPVEDSHYAARVRRAINAHGLSGRIHWLPELRGQDKRNAFAASEFMVLPTLSDNFAIVVAEALALSMPVITTTEALPWSVIEERGCGWWVPMTTTALAETIRMAISLPPETLRSLGEKGRKLVEDRFRWDDLACDFIQTYDWLLGHADRPSFVITD